MKMSGYNMVGPYFLGPSIGSSPVKSITQYVARHRQSTKFKTIKVLTLKEPDEETADDKQGKLLLHNERSILSLLKGEKGVIQQHGLFQETKKTKESGRRIVKRVFLVLDCLVAHDFDPESAWSVNLQHFLLKEKSLTEREALMVFLGIMDIIERLHAKNIVHRDIKLGNLIFNCRSKEVTIVNFCLGKHLANDKELLRDQRGSPAYVSPDILSAKPYRGKPSDMWALGVVLYTMLFGQFPFCETAPQDLFRKIRTADYNIPSESSVSDGACELVRGLLTLDPAYRLTAAQAKEKTWSVILSWRKVTSSFDIRTYQVVPEWQGSSEVIDAESGERESEMNMFQDSENAEVPEQPETQERTERENVRVAVRLAEGTLRHLSTSELAALLPPQFQSSLLTPPPPPEPAPDAGRSVLAQFMARVVERERERSTSPSPAENRVEPRRPRHNFRPIRSRRSAARGAPTGTLQRTQSVRMRRDGLSAVRRGRVSRQASTAVPSTAPVAPSAARVEDYLSQLFSAAGASNIAVSQISSEVVSRLQSQRSTQERESQDGAAETADGVADNAAGSDAGTQSASVEAAGNVVTADDHRA